jgi:hypothetical protein
MRGLAARFRSLTSARAALVKLRKRFGLREDEADAASMRTGAVLAGQFREELVPEVTAIVREYNGRIVADLPRELTRPTRRRRSASRPPARPRLPATSWP